MALAPRYNPRPPQAIRSDHISYVGMRDAKDPSTANPRMASFLLNVYPVDPTIGGGLEGRPGYVALGLELPGTTQLVYQFSKRDGTEFLIGISGGRFYTYDWAEEEWDEVLEAADFASASISLSSTSRFRAVTFTDQVILTDGVNTPWMWDGTTGGGLTSLSNVPIAFGPPTIYYGKIFFIKANERSTFVWSEENQPNTGYEAGGFNNAWTLGQTAQEALTRLIGTNEALYYFRERSAGAISGAVSEDFQTTGTQEAVSQTIGTSSPDSVIYHQGTLWWVDADARVQRYYVGGGFQEPPPWVDARETLEKLPRSQLDNIVVQHRPLENLIIFAVTPVGQDDNQQQMVFHADAGIFSGVWDGMEVVTQALVKNSAGDPVSVHGDSTGQFYLHGTPQGTQFTDDGVAITHAIHASPVLWDTRDEKYFTRLDLSFRLESNLTNIGISTISPSCTGANLSPSQILGSLSIWGEAIWGESLWSSGSVEAHLAVGIDCRGRWIQPRISHDTLGERFAFLGWSVIAYHAGSDPNIP